MMRHEQRLLESHASSEEKLQTGKNLYDIIFMSVLEIKLNRRIVNYIFSWFRGYFTLE